MRATNLFAFGAMAIWIAWLWSGMHLIQSIIAQHTAGYPDANQVEFLIGIPVKVLTIMIAATLAVNVLNRFAGALVTISAIALIGILPYMMFYGGGV